MFGAQKNMKNVKKLTNVEVDKEQQWKVAMNALSTAEDAWHAALFSVPGYEGWNFEPDDLRRVLDRGEATASESLLKVLVPAEQEITRILNALVLNFVETDEKWRARRALCSGQGFTQGRVAVVLDSMLRQTDIFLGPEIDEHVHQLENLMPKVIVVVEAYAEEGNFRFCTTLTEKARSLIAMSWGLISENLPPREEYEAFFGCVRTILSILSYNVCRIQTAFRLFGAEAEQRGAEAATDLNARLARQAARKKRARIATTAAARTTKSLRVPLQK